MLCLLDLSLEAHNPDKGHHRAYHVAVGVDLFAEWTVTIRFGRAGKEGRTLLFSAPTQAGARRIVAQNLRRRTTAPHRIGVPYSITKLEADPSIKAADWIPPGLLDS